MTDQVLQLCRGRVMHLRLRPFVHRFVYRIFCLRLRLDKPADLKKHHSWLFGFERAGVVSFHSRDHGARDGGDLMRWLKNQLLVAEADFEPGAVWLQCFPRVFGYVFNPVSFWFVHDKAGDLKAILAEVNNTFGQRHQYLLFAPNRQAITDETLLECLKVFHVSPFCDVTGCYRFKQITKLNYARMAIDYFEQSEDIQPLLRTALVVRPIRFSTADLLKALFTMPMMTLGVMFRIHMQAFRLWRGGANYHPVSPLPEQNMTHNLGPKQ